MVFAQVAQHPRVVEQLASRVAGMADMLSGS